MEAEIKHHGTRHIEYGDFVVEPEVFGRKYTITGAFQLHTYMDSVRVAFSLPGYYPMLERWKPCKNIDDLPAIIGSAVVEVIGGSQRDGERGEFGEL